MVRTYHPRRSALWVPFAVAVALVALPVHASIAQVATNDSTARSRHSLDLVTIGSPTEDDLRVRQLQGGPASGFLLRSPSSLARRSASADRMWRAFFMTPTARITYNSDLPYSLNDGALWAGRGKNLALSGGGGVDAGRVRLIVAPVFVYSDNEDYALADPAISQPVPTTRSSFSSPWHAGAQSIDLPIRFGRTAIDRLTPGQSSLVVVAGPIELGAATENDWWGPGLRNALLLSNNAEGFPHLLVRTAHPIQSPIGAFEARWIAGGLTESPYFDFDPSDDLRSIALFGVTLEPRGTQGLTVGGARSVVSTTRSWGAALTSFPQAFAGVGHPDAVPLTDSTSVGGRDALVSLFARYVMPAAGAEVYGEWGRAESPRSIRDFLEQPNHSQAYTLGLQWLGRAITRTGGRLRAQAEATYLEQSTTYRFRPIGSWYTSHAVPQGFTERGQTIGAAIGPGSSSQFIALDHLATDWQLGAYLTRVRWLEDAETQKPYPVSDMGRCSHDVSTLPGVRGRMTTAHGTFFADYSSGWRLNVFFDRPSYCGSPSRSARNKSLTIGFAPR